MEVAVEGRDIQGQTLVHKALGCWILSLASHAEAGDEGSCTDFR